MRVNNNPPYMVQQYPDQVYSLYVIQNRSINLSMQNSIYNTGKITFYLHNNVLLHHFLYLSLSSRELYIIWSLSWYDLWCRKLISLHASMFADLWFLYSSKFYFSTPTSVCRIKLHKAITKDKAMMSTLLALISNIVSVRHDNPDKHYTHMYYAMFAGH